MTTGSRWQWEQASEAESKSPEIRKLCIHEGPTYRPKPTPQYGHSSLTDLTVAEMALLLCLALLKTTRTRSATRMTKEGRQGLPVYRTLGPFARPPWRAGVPDTKL